MNKLIMVILAMLLAVPIMGNAQDTASKFNTADTACPVIVKYIGSSTNNFTITANNLTAVFDGSSSTKSLGPTITTADVAGFLNAITNGDGHAVFKAKVWEALSTDIVTNKIRQCTNFVAGSTWDKSIFKWDTSVALTYDAICDVPNSAGMPMGAYEITGIVGDPTGTGNVTLNVYGDDTMLYQKTFTSPVYVPTDVGTTNTAADAVVTLESANFPGIWIGAGQRGLVRATRATTATTGGVGATIKNR